MQKHATSLIFYKEKILLLLRDNIPSLRNPNMWQSIGGKVEEGESFEEGVKREIYEETNLQPSKIKYLGKMVHPDFELAVYLVRLDKDEMKSLKLGNEGQEIRFFGVEELESINLTPRARGIFEKNRQQFEQLSQGVDLNLDDMDLN